MPELEQVSPLFPVLEQLHMNLHATRQAIETALAPVRKEAAASPRTLSREEVARLVNELTELQDTVRQFRETHLWLVKQLRGRTDVDLPDILVDCATYLGERGHFASLQQLQRLYPSLKAVVDVDLLKEEAQLISELEHGELERVLDWCAKHRSAIKKVDPALLIELQKLKFDQMCAIDTESAIIFAQAAFRKAEPVHFHRISHAVRALYSDPKVDRKEPVPPELVQRLRSAIRHAHHRPAASVLASRALLGLAAIKTRRCASEASTNGVEGADGVEGMEGAEGMEGMEGAEGAEGANRAVNGALNGATKGTSKGALRGTNVTACPACNPDYRALVETIPASHHSYSKLEPDMIVLPKTNLLTSRANISRAGNVDPVSGKEVDWSQVTKAYAL